MRLSSVIEQHEVEEGIVADVRDFINMITVSKAIVRELEHAVEQAQAHNRKAHEYRLELRTKLEAIRNGYKQMYNTRREQHAIDDIVDGFVQALRQHDPLFH